MMSPHSGGFNPAFPQGDSNRGQPEVASEEVSADTPICNLDDINSCAHLNSGILNKASFLAVAGGQFNGQQISGIGFTKMTAIINKAISDMGRLPTLKKMATLYRDCLHHTGASPSKRHHSR